MLPTDAHIHKFYDISIGDVIELVRVDLEKGLCHLHLSFSYRRLGDRAAVLYLISYMYSSEHLLRKSST